MTKTDKKTQIVSRRDTGAETPVSLKRVSSEMLMGDRQELIIEHAGREYVLRVTQNGKLILTA